MLSAHRRRRLRHRHRLAFLDDEQALNPPSTAVTAGSLHRRIQTCQRYAIPSGGIGTGELNESRTKAKLSRHAKQTQPMTRTPSPWSTWIAMSSVGPRREPEQGSRPRQLIRATDQESVAFQMDLWNPIRRHQRGHCHQLPQSSARTRRLQTSAR